MVFGVLLFSFSLCIIFFSLLKSSLCATYRSNPCSVILQTKTVVEELCRARKQEARDRIWQSCPENRERKCIFLGRSSRLQPKRQSHPLFQTTGVTQINRQHEITPAERYFRKYSTPWMTYSSITSLEI